MKASYKTTRRIRPLASAVRTGSKFWMSLMVGSAALVAGCSEEPAPITTATIEATTAPAVAAVAPAP